MIRTSLVILLALSAAMAGCAGRFPDTGWPIEPRDQTHPIGNSGGEFQQYTGNPYFHTGIDIVDDDPAPNGPYVRTTRAGTVALSLPGAGSLYNGLTVSHGDSTHSSYKYWHLDFNSIPQAVRDAETNGTVLAADSQAGQLVFWTACDYHHVHFETCDDAGCQDPVWDLVPRNDTNGPFITDLQFTDNGSTTVFTPGFPDTNVSGQVDIVARAGDRQFATATQDHRTGVMKIRYQVTDLNTNAVVKTGKTIKFTDIPPDGETTVLYRNAAPFDSTSDYCGTESYYYVVSNVDDADAKNFDETFAWDTTTHPNGRYRVSVQVWDASGNSTTILKQVRIAN